MSDFLNQLVALAIGFYGINYAKVLFYLLLANLVSGLASALVTKQFTLAKIADWLQKIILVYAGFTAVLLLVLAMPDLQSTTHAVDLAFATLTAFMLGEIGTNIGELGFTIPSVTVTEPPRPAATPPAPRPPAEFS